MVVIEVITKNVIKTLMICKVTNKTYINYNVTLGVKLLIKFVKL